MQLTVDLLKPAGIPRVIYLLSRPACQIHAQDDLTLRISSKKSLFHYTPMYVLRGNDYVKILIIRAAHLPGMMSAAVYAMFGQFPSRRRIYGIADLLRRRSRRLYVKLILKPALSDHVLQHVFSHWAAAYIAPADEQHSYHRNLLYYRYHTFFPLSDGLNVV